MPKLPTPTFTVPVDQSLDDLAPKFRAKIDELLKLVPDAVVYETLRTNARQEYLYGFGRDYDDGRGVVTHSETALDTWHHYGLACDLVHQNQGWDAPVSWWKEFGKQAKNLGLVWGGDWTFRDYPHVQWGSPMRRSPSPSAATLQSKGGNPAVWQAVGAA